ncbi:MAG: hypothetical protein ACRDBX_08545 [Erysipelotrichaceae bacterium]
MDHIKNAVRSQLAEKRFLLLGLLLAVNLLAVVAQVGAITLLGSTSFFAQLGANFFSFLIMFVNGAIWFVFLQAARGQSTRFQDLGIGFREVLLLILGSFTVQLVVMAVTYVLLLLTNLIPFLGIFVIYLLPLVSILVIPVNGFIAFQIKDGNPRVFAIVRGALGLLKKYFFPCLQAVLPYFVWVMLFSLAQQLVFANVLQVEATSFLALYQSGLQTGFDMSTLLVSAAMELGNVAMMAFLMVKAYLTIANIYRFNQNETL